jgi:glyoxylase-like metal-dependent hydrolase (beta-lactamase superfamily II)
MPYAEKFAFLEDGQQLISGLYAEAAYGHSLGHMMYRLVEGDKQILIWGDVANHYVFSVQHPESPVAFDDDPEQAIATRKRVLDMATADKLMVIGHHMPFPSIGYVERINDTFRWVPAFYQKWL